MSGIDFQMRLSVSGRSGVSSVGLTNLSVSVKWHWFWIECQCQMEKNCLVSGVGITPFMGPINFFACRMHRGKRTHPASSRICFAIWPWLPVFLSCSFPDVWVPDRCCENTTELWQCCDVSLHCTQGGDEFIPTQTEHYSSFLQVVLFSPIDKTQLHCSATHFDGTSSMRFHYTASVKGNQGAGEYRIKSLNS